MQVHEKLKEIVDRAKTRGIETCIRFMEGTVTISASAPGCFVAKKVTTVGRVVEDTVACINEVVSEIAYWRGVSEVPKLAHDSWIEDSPFNCERGPVFSQ